MSHATTIDEHKHATASVFLFGRVGEAWRLGLVRHPRFGKLMLPGGHVEAFENAAEAALREVLEETGLEAALVTGSATVGVTLRGLVAVPLWLAEQEVPADSHYGSPHIHVDHLYVAVAESMAPSLPAAHEFAWYSEAELASLDMFPGTRALALALFGGGLDLLLGVPAGAV